MNEIIHIYKENNFENIKIAMVMIPCVVFLIVLIVVLSVSSYHTQVAANTTVQNVLGTSSK